MHIETKLWGKKKEKHGQYYWLPLEQHLLDTSNVMIQLWNHWLSEGQKELIMSSISPPEKDPISLISFIGLTHDLGKATPSFSLKFSATPDLDLMLKEKLISSGLLIMKEWYSESFYKTPHAIAGQVLLNSYGVSEDIASIIGGHHGKPADNKLEIKNQLESYASNYYQYDFENEQTEKWKNIQRDLFDWALKEAGYEDINCLPQIKYGAQILLKGLLIMADWIASNEEYFPLFPIERYIEESQGGRLEYAWRGWSKTFPWTPDYLDDILELYNRRFDFQPREIQCAFFEAIDKAETPGIIILEAPMGVGKTEAALLGVEQMAVRKKCSGMFFGLPTQATSDGIFTRINEWLQKIVCEVGDDMSIQLLHGKAQFNESFQKLRYTDSVNTEGGNVVINEWFVGRKTAILDDFVVGTVDQLLLAGLKQRHLALRHLGLSKKVIVVDEVHAYDSYMSVFLDRIVEWLGAYRIPVIILSATLPAFRRERLIKTYFNGMGVKSRNIQTDYSDWAKTNEYPLITYTDNSKVSQFREFKLEHEKEVKVEIIEEDNLVEILKKLLANGGVVGIIVNTVKRAQVFAQKLGATFGEENISVLHSSFLATHRRNKEKKLIEEIGKNEKRPKFKIVIGTQVLEQSLDIDFDALFTDIAPIDLILQRIGRLQRHNETKRPESLKEAVVYIMGILGNGEFEEGTKKIYGEYLLIRTQLVLQEKILLPFDISKLVQKVYTKEGLNIPQLIREQHDKAEVENELEKKRRENNAKAFLLKKPSDSEGESLIGWLSDDLSVKTEEAGLAKVRDGIDSIEVILIKRKGDDMYLLDEKTKINTELTPSLAKKISRQTIRLPHIFHYKNDEIIKELEQDNIEKLSYWQSEPWLKGSLGVILDEENCTKLVGYKIKYDDKYGLLYEKEEK